MTGKELQIEDKRCLVFSDEAPEVLLVEPMDERDLEFLDREIAVLKEGTDRPFALAALVIEDWNRELTPWAAGPVFGKEPFGEGAAETLRLIEDGLLPRMENLFPSLKGKERILGGYSLAALFALWCAYQSDSFAGIAAASPSVWYPGWMDFVRSRTPRARRIYLSLGDKEYKSRNKTMAAVETCIRAYADILSATEGTSTTLEWNPGNHFVEADRRTARAFVWTMQSRIMTHAMTEKEQMLAGLPYSAEDLILLKELNATKDVIHRYNALLPSQEEEKKALLKDLLGHIGDDDFCINQPFYCDYGKQIRLGRHFFANFNFTVLDEAPVTIGDNCFIGPNVSIYTACHSTDPVERNNRREWAEPVTIGNNVWIGGSVTVLPGVTIGHNTTIGAGSVVTKDIPDNVVAAGNPCRVIRKLGPEQPSPITRSEP